MSEKVAKYEGPYGVEFDANYDLIADLIASFKASLDDGFQIKDIVTWTPLIISAYDSAKAIFAKDVDQEKVTAMAQYIYCAVDPNLPFIPEFIENKVEKWIIIELAIPLAVNSAWEAVQNYIDKQKSK